MATITASSTSPVTTATIQDICSILIVVFAGTGALLFSRILFLYRFRPNTGLRVRTFTRSMITYMTMMVFGAGIVVLWRICFVIYRMNRYGIFKLGYAFPVVPEIKVVYDWFERGYLVSIGAMPLTVFFLALERCLAIQMPFKFSNNPIMERVLFLLNVMGSLGTSIIVYLVSSVNVWPFKMTVGILNTFACGFLIWKMKKTKSTTSDAIVRTTTLMEMCLEFFPNLLVFVIGQVKIFALPILPTMPCGSENFLIRPQKASHSVGLNLELNSITEDHSSMEEKDCSEVVFEESCQLVNQGMHQGVLSSRTSTNYVCVFVQHMATLTLAES